MKIPAVSFFHYSYPSFGANKSKNKVCAIDRYANAEIYPGVLTAASDKSLTRGGIYNCLLGRSKIAGDYTFRYAKDLYKEGTEELDKEKVMQAALSPLSKALYLIRSDGSYDSFNSMQQAAQSLNVSYRTIENALNSRNGKLGNAVLKRASEIDEADSEGKFHPNPQKIAEVLESIDVTPIYAVDLHENYRKFSSSDEASKALNISKNSIYECLKGCAMSSHGYAFCTADSLQKDDKTIDKNKLKEIASLNKPYIYAIFQDGSYKVYKTVKEASYDLEIGERNIRNNLGGRNVSKVQFAYSYDVEKKDENGNYVVDGRKIKKIIDNSIFKFYSYNLNTGEVLEFDSLESACEKTGVARTTISRILKGTCEISGDYTFLTSL